MARTNYTWEKRQKELAKKKKKEAKMQRKLDKRKKDTEEIGQPEGNDQAEENEAGDLSQ